MIDYIKCYFSDNKDVIESRLRRNKDLFQLSEKQNLYNSNVEVCNLYAKIGNMDIRITPHKGYMRNSIHKLYNLNNGEEPWNHNDFNIQNIKSTISQIEGALGLDASKMKLTNLEFGFNVKTNKSPEHIVQKNVRMYKFKEPVENEVSPRKAFKKFKSTQFEIKIYSKKAQYTLPDNILRVELKITKSEYLHRLGIGSLHNLKECVTYETLMSNLWQKLDDLMIIDDFNTGSMNEEVVKDLRNYLDPHYWIYLKETATKSTYYRRQNECKRLIQDLQLEETKKTILNLLDAKFRELMRDECIDCDPIYQNAA